ncbi:hypothetical protein [Sphingomonas sp. UNC305MFCol5.2]|uniref:hypothetical protein n=1 Tax=Sphingomonas sp. UNC305MFCol5.2 TaxID=1449076 RepID=UPI0004A3E22E|nr:hypothetical protein [Sphingomonas sp. UNC305MFCol5.2]
MRNLPAFRCRSSVAATLRFGAVALALCVAAPALAQDLSGQDDEIAAPYAEQPAASVTSPKISDKNDKKTGERQARDAVEGIEPMARINNRIPNRIPNRIQNRIDRDFRGIGTATAASAAAQSAARRSNAQGRP